MPYRRLPKTDTARLKALEALADNNEVYAVSGHFIDRKLIAEAQRLYANLSDASAQYKISMRTQVRYSKRIAALQHKAMTYLSHFLQVMFLAVERGEIQESDLTVYGLDANQHTVPYLKTADAVMEWAPKVIKGEKERLKKGGKPVLTPPIGAVSVHFDVFRNMYEAQKQYQTRTQMALADMTKMRPEVDSLILKLWDVIEEHFSDQPLEKRCELCRKFGVVYYYRRNEKK